MRNFLRGISLAALISFLFLTGYSQQAGLHPVSGKTIQGTPGQTRIYGSLNNYMGGNQLMSVTCGNDTVRYPLAKATSLTPYAASPQSGVMGVGQWYPAPQNITVYGIEFFAWVDSATNQTATITGAVYNAQADSTPVAGPPLASGTLVIDSNFYGGVLGLLRKRIIFNSPATVTGNYVVTLTNGSLLGLGIVGNTAPNGLGENLAEINVNVPPVVGWFKMFSDLSGPDADLLIHPIVSYTLTSSFSAAPTSTCAGQTVNFTNNSSPIFTSRFYNVDYFPPPTNRTWLWNFGDASATVRTQTASHTYAAAGTFTSSLRDTLFTWSTASGVCVDTSAVTITVSSSAPPVAAWTPSITNNVVSFTDASTGGITSWSWDFGDGATSTQQNPTHTYSSSGTYTVCLTVTNQCSQDSACQQITVTCVPVVASFIPNPNSLVVNFQNTSQGVPTSYSWDFGDGTNSALPNPNHTYNAPGNYQVCLTILNSCDTSTTCQTITLTCPAPAPYFNFTTVGPYVNFTGTASPAPTTWAWTFGDGGTSSVQNPQHTYLATGTYQACLKTSSICGSDSICRTVVITCVPPTSSFSYTVANDSIIVVSNQSSPNSTGYIWHFGDGTTSLLQNPPAHTYAAPGVYQVCLVVTNPCGSDTICQTVNITCSNLVTAAFTSVQNGGTVQFTNTSLYAQSYSWDFGDGSASSNLANPSHSYTTNGGYLACLTATNYCGSNTHCYYLIIQCTTPVSNFGFTQGNQLVSFSDQSTGNPTSWYWTFGDGGSDTIQNPSHSYLYPGYFRICLTVTNSCGTNTYCDTVLVTTVGTDADWQNSLSMYPNPAQNEVRFSGNSSNPVLNVNLLDLNGKAVLRQNGNGAGETLLNISSLAKGVYFAQIETAKGILTKKLIIE